MDVVKQAFYKIQKHNIPIYHVQTPNLERYTTTKKDAKEGITRIPHESKLVTEGENLYSEELKMQKEESHIGVRQTKYKKLLR